jgi:hypothetical protein
MRDHSLQFWFGIAFIVFMAFRLLEGIATCEATQWAVCPGQWMDDDSNGEEEDE